MSGIGVMFFVSAILTGGMVGLCGAVLMLLGNEMDAGNPEAGILAVLYLGLALFALVIAFLAMWGFRKVLYGSL